jgi:hypothetical protein
VAFSSKVTAIEVLKGRAQSPRLHVLSAGPPLPLHVVSRILGEPHPSTDRSFCLPDTHLKVQVVFEFPKTNSNPVSVSYAVDERGRVGPSLNEDTRANLELADENLAIDDRLVRPTIIRKWFHLCDRGRHHGTGFQPSSGSDRPKILLIDNEQQCLVKASSAFGIRF